ncbi:MAG: hypothetical protein U0793_07060 [Gemmataceae bacterium]
MAAGDPSIVVLFALRRESSFFLKTLSGTGRIATQRFAAWTGNAGTATVLVLETGIGAAQTQRGLDWLIGAFRPRHLVAAGFCGGLDPLLRVGAVVQAGEVVDEGGALVPLAVQPLAMPRVRLVTCPRLLATAAERASLATAHQAQTVDMESVHIARFGRDHGIPVTCVRAVSDDARSSLAPVLADLLSAGRVSAGRLTCALLRRPWLLRQMLRLARDTRVAGHNLALVLRELVEMLGQDVVRSGSANQG